jgi:hypothetical protein
MRTRLDALPGVAAITSASAPILPGRKAAVSLNGKVPSTQNTRATLSYTYVQANYFDTLGIPILSGFNFQSQSDRSEATVILSESAAQRLWPGQIPIGRNLRLGTGEQVQSNRDLTPDGLDYQVIGVARDTRGASLDGSDSEMVYGLCRKTGFRNFPS